MAANITIIKEAPLTIYSENPVIDRGNDSTGAKVFTVDKPYKYTAGVFSGDHMRFNNHIVNINGINFGGNGRNNAIELLEEDTCLRIIIR